jgi:hypothetical protein
MNKSKKLFTYQNTIILPDGSSLQVTSVKYIKNHQLNSTIFKKTQQKNSLNDQSNRDRSIISIQKIK